MKAYALEEMLDHAKCAMQNAYNPYSHFFVGACILADDGHLYSGCNVENASYSLTLCAEVSAITAMITAGAKRIVEMLVVSSSDKIVVPCGACRQRIREFSDLSTKIHMCNHFGQHEVMTIDELLPKSFGPEFLENK